MITSDEHEDYPLANSFIKNIEVTSENIDIIKMITDMNNVNDEKSHRYKWVTRMYRFLVWTRRNVFRKQNSIGGTSWGWSHKKYRSCFQAWTDFTLGVYIVFEYLQQWYLPHATNLKCLPPTVGSPIWTSPSKFNFQTQKAHFRHVHTKFVGIHF